MRPTRLPKFSLKRQYTAPASTSYASQHPPDSWTNVPPSILAKKDQNLYLNPSHPIGILRSLIHSSLSSYTSIPAPSPIVSTYKNFDELGFPPDHPGRSVKDSYYLNQNTMLRTHTSAHEVDTFRMGHDRWILTADVYRRDEIDYSHYPVFHQMEGADVVARENVSDYGPRTEKLERELSKENVLIEDTTRIGKDNDYQPEHDPKEVDLAVAHLKATINTMFLGMLREPLQKTGEKLQIRWIDAFFPFTSPSYEVEILYKGKWMEMLGSGIIKQHTLNQAGMSHKMGWAFGLGLERIAMLLFNIPDIRLFWSQDERFLSQFQAGRINEFKPYSKYPTCYKDTSFWAPTSFHENDFCEIVRELCGDLVESVTLIDNFLHPKTKRTGLCYRINYRSMDRNLTNEEVNVIHARVVQALEKQMALEMR
ncbi:phenylalanyl-tRNA synthetase [Atractiella rhizophila]|nr:phenylalanyl-tRNA synthetase [Atractiella rhizophila]